MRRTVPFVFTFAACVSGGAEEKSGEDTTRDTEVETPVSDTPRDTDAPVDSDSPGIDTEIAVETDDRDTDLVEPETDVAETDLADSETDALQDTGPRPETDTDDFSDSFRGETGNAGWYDSADTDTLETGLTTPPTDDTDSDVTRGDTSNSGWFDTSSPGTETGLQDTEVEVDPEPVLDTYQDETGNAGWYDSSDTYDSGAPATSGGTIPVTPPPADSLDVPWSTSLLGVD